MNRIARTLAIAAVGLVLSSCGKKEEAPKPAPSAPPPKAQTAPPPGAPALAVSQVNVGKAIGPDKKITAATTEFAKNDTMYVSVDTTGAGNAKIDAKWTYSRDGKTVVVKEESMNITTMGPATNELHVSKPDGWPPGSYTVEVSMDGKPVGTKQLTVK